MWELNKMKGKNHITFYHSYLIKISPPLPLPPCLLCQWQTNTKLNKQFVNYAITLQNMPI